MAVQSIVLTGARVLGFAAAFIIPIVLVRLFSQEDFGTYKGAFLIAQTAVQVLGFGLPASIFFFLPRDRHDGHRYLAQGVILLALAGALGAMALFVAGPTLVRLMGAPGLLAVLPWLALLLLVDAPSSLAHTVPIADQRAVLAGTVVVSSDILRATALIAAALLFRSVGAVVAAAALIGMLRVAFLLGYMGFRRIPGSPGISWASIKEQLAYALPFWSALLLQVGSRRTHAYYVMAAVPTAEFAVYSVGIFQLPLVQHITNSTAEVMLVRATEAHEQGDTATMRSIWTRGTVRLAIMLVPFWVATQIFAPDLFLLLFEARYLPAVPVFRIFVTLFLLLIVVDHGILRATGDTKYLVRASAIGFGAMLLALLLLTRWNVQLGAVMAFIVGAAVMRGVGLIRVAERLEIPVLRCVPWRAIAGSGGLALIAGAAGFVASDWLEGALLRLAVGGVVFSVAYCALVYVFSLVPREEIRGLLARFNPARRPRGSDS